jgi:hypothetical protein
VACRGMHAYMFVMPCTFRPALIRRILIYEYWEAT